MLKVFMLPIISIAIYLAYLVFQNKSTGLNRLSVIETSLKVQQKENNELKSRNEMLQADIKNLHENLSAMEELARKELGLIQRDETFFHIIEDEKDHTKE